MKKLKDMMWEEDAGGGGSPGAAVFDTVETEGAPTEPAPAAPAAPAFDVKALAQEFGNVVSERLKPQPAAEPAAPQMTAEEAKKLLKIWEPSDEWLAQFDNLETRKAAVAAMRDGLTQQFVTILQHYVGEREQNLDQRYSPALTYVQQQEAAARETRFNGSYPQLADPALKPLILSVANGLKASGKTFESEAKLFEALANGVEAVVKVNNPEFKITPAAVAAGKTNGKGATPPNAIPVTTPGAMGGAGAAKPASQMGKKPGLAIFD